MERLEQILKWSWLAMPILAPGWVLIAVSVLGAGTWVFIMAYYIHEWYEGHGPFTQATLVSLFGLAPMGFFGWGVATSNDLAKWLPYDYFHEWTILHWFNILG